MEAIKEGILEGCKGITTIDLGGNTAQGNYIGPRGAECIKQLFEGGCVAIEFLDLEGNNIGDEGLALISEGIQTGGGRLSYLNLSANRLTPTGMKPITPALVKGCIQIRTLVLDSIYL